MWPTALQLSPSQHNPVPVQLLIQWASRQQCLPLQVLQHPQAPDPKANDEHFRALHRLLTEKNVVRVSSSLLSSRKLPATHCLVPPVGQYALSAWPPSEPKNRLLIFPHNGLAAVFFYGPGGMPELPKPQDRSPVPPGTRTPIDFPVTVPVSVENSTSTVAFPISSPEQVYSLESPNGLRSRYNSYADFDSAQFIRSRVQSRLSDWPGIEEPGWRTRRESTA